MELITQELRKKLPPLHGTEEQLDPIIWVKLFTPWTYWTWYVLEFDGTDICYGYVEGEDKELGYFSLSELATPVGPAGLKVERDLYFKPCPLSEKYKAWAGIIANRLKEAQATGDEEL